MPIPQPDVLISSVQLLNRLSAPPKPPPSQPSQDADDRSDGARKRPRKEEPLPQKLFDLNLGDRVRVTQTSRRNEIMSIEGEVVRLGDNLVTVRTENGTAKDYPENGFVISGVTKL
jgi:hypothetical protein